MTAYVLDYSAGLLTGAQVKAYRGKPESDAVYVGAIRYAGSLGQQRKEATKKELDSYVSNGLGVALVYETTAGWWRGGRNAGVAAAQAIKADATAMGYWGKIRAYFFTADEDVTPSTLPLFRAAIQGAVSVLGFNLVGAYGEADVIDSVVGPLCRWGWQTRAWSGGRVSSKAHVLQLIGYVHPGGFDADRSKVLANNGDWGQYPAPGEDRYTVDAADKAYFEDLKADIVEQVHHDAGMVIRGDAAHPDNIAKMRVDLFGRAASGDTPAVKGAIPALTDMLTAQGKALDVLAQMVAGLAQATEGDTGMNAEELRGFVRKTIADSISNDDDTEGGTQ